MDSNAGEGIHIRIFDMFDSLLLSKDPFRPARVTIRHSSEDDLRDLETRVPKADCRIESKAVI